MTKVVAPTAEQIKEDVAHRIGEISMLRDQIRLDLHLAGMDLRDEWTKLEKKLPELDQALLPLKSAARDALDTLVNELRRFSERLRDGAEYTVAAIMTRSPARCLPAASLAEALALMWDRDAGALPVVNQEGALVGMITDRDAAIAAASRGQRMDQIRVDSVMSTGLAKCTPSTPWDEALGLMRGQQVRRLPVVGEDDVLVGIVTLNDIARALEAAGREARHPSFSQLLMKTYLTVGQRAASWSPAVN